MVKKSILILCFLFVVGVLFSSCSNSSSTTSADNTVQVQKENGAVSDSQIQQDSLALLIADGTYSEDLYYDIPHHTTQDQVHLDMVISEGVVDSISLTAVKVDHESNSYINALNSALQTLVVGKSISEVELPDIVAGASLTTPALKEKLESLSSTA